MKHNIAFTGLLLLLCTLAQAQQESASRDFWTNFKVRRAFESLEDKNAPAISTITFPKEGSNSFMVNGGISYTLVKILHNGTNVRWAFSPFAVLNYNTLIEKQQKNYKTGINCELMMGNLSLPKRKLRYFMLDQTLEYSKDYLDTSHSVIYTAYFSQVASGAASRLWLNTYRHIGKGLHYFLAYSAGPELQHRFDVSEPAVKGIKTNGTTARMFYHTEARLLQKVFKKEADASLGNPFAELVLSNTGRYDLINTSDHREGYLPLFSAGLTIYPTFDYNFSLGFSFITGSDPLAGLAKQSYCQLAVRFKR